MLLSKSYPLPYGVVSMGDKFSCNMNAAAYGMPARTLFCPPLPAHKAVTSSEN